MAITEQSRHELYRHLIETMGEERAATLMAHLPPVGWADVATKHDLGHLQDVIDLRFDGVEGRLERLEGRMERVEGRLERVEARLEGRVDSVEAGLAAVRTEIADLRAHIDHKLSTHLFAVLGFTLSFGGLLVAAAHLS